MLKIDHCDCPAAQGAPREIAFDTNLIYLANSHPPPTHPLDPHNLPFPCHHKAAEVSCLCQKDCFPPHRPCSLHWLDIMEVGSLGFRWWTPTSTGGPHAPRTGVGQDTSPPPT